MRILLVIPTTAYGTSYPTLFSNTDFPVGFAYLASALRAAGHEVFGLNPNNDPNYFSAQAMLNDKLTRSLADCRPDLIGLGGLCTDYHFIKDAIKICRRHAPAIPIVCGGGIITHDGPFIFETLKPDFCIVGEAEERLVHLADTLESDIGDFQNIPNLGYWMDGSARFTACNLNYPNVDTRRFPDYEPFGIRELLNNYGYAARNSYRYTRTDPRPMTIVTARGCPFNCTFCVHQRGPKYRARSLDNIMQELEEMYDKYHFNILIILDELFAVNRSRLREFCELIIQRKNTLGWDFDWNFQTHASASFTIEDFKLAKRAGCYYLSYGLESASQTVLDSMNKKTKPAQYATAVAIAHEAEIGFGGNFIFGDFAETTETIAETFDFFRRYLLDDHVWLVPVKPYPGSKLYDDCIKRGIISNALEFYECGDRITYNMTSIQNDIWLPWVSELLSLTGSLSWARATRAESYRYDTSVDRAAILSRIGTSLIEYTAVCPNCGRKVKGLEPVGTTHEGGMKGFISTVVRAYKIENGNNINFLKRHVLPFFWRRIPSFRCDKKHPIFHLLEELRGQEEPARWVFATGCPQCNKRFRVIIQK